MSETEATVFVCLSYGVEVSFLVDITCFYLTADESEKQEGSERVQNEDRQHKKG